MHLDIKNNSIGIFDSGIGGLTVASYIKNILPKEKIIYVGDTAHLPYGDKDKAQINERAIKIINFLLLQKCKIVLIACHSASSAIFYHIKDLYKNSEVMDIISPTIKEIKQNFPQKKVTLIGTPQTVNSGIYQSMANSFDIDLTIKAIPPLALAIEQYGNDKNKINIILEQYLSDNNLYNSNALILACTHYPIIKNLLQNFFCTKTQIIDPAAFIANETRIFLQKNNLLTANNNCAKVTAYLTKHSNNFAKNAKLFFTHDVVFNELNL